MALQLLAAREVVDDGGAALALRQTPEVDVLAVVGDDVTVTGALRVEHAAAAVEDVDPVGATRLAALDLSHLAVERTLLDGSQRNSPLGG